MPRRIATVFLLSFAAFTISCASDKTVGPDTQPQQPEPQQPEGTMITGVLVTASAYTALVGSTVKMMAAVSAENGVRYTVEWSLKGGTNTATIDTSTGVLTAMAPGFAYPRACATATMNNGQTRSVCDETSIRIVAPFTPVRLAFVRNGTIFVTGPDELEPVALIPEALRPSWSPDGTQIAFTRPASNQLAPWQLCIAKQDGSDIRCARGASNGLVVGKPSWSPDGATVAFSVFDSYRSFSSLSLLNTNTMRIDVLETPPVTSASWSPDGRKIAIVVFGVGTFGRGALATINADGSGLNYLAMSDTYSVAEVSWSPDGGRLALSLRAENVCPWYCDTAIGIVNADGTQLKVLDRARTCFATECRAEESYIWGAPEWVGIGNGGRVAYTMTRGGECYIDERASCGTDVMIADVDDGRIELLMSAAGFLSWWQ